MEEPETETDLLLKAEIEAVYSRARRTALEDALRVVWSVVRSMEKQEGEAWRAVDTIGCGISELMTRDGPL